MFSCNYDCLLLKCLVTALPERESVEPELTDLELVEPELLVEPERLLLERRLCWVLQTAS